MKAWYCSFAIAVASILTGCASYPLPVSEPSPKTKVLVKEENGTETIKEERRLPDYQRGGLLPAMNLLETKENLKIYADWYRQVSDKLRTGEYSTSDVVFGGGVLAAIGGLANSQGAAIVGAATASGASMVSQRYQAQVQATNYDRAGDAMYCMYRILYPLNRELVESSRLSVPEHERVRNSLISIVNERIDEIRLKLRDAQAKVILVSPDIKQLEEAVKGAQTKKGQVAAQASGHDVTKTIAESRAAEKSAVGAMRANIDQRPLPSPSEIAYFETHLPTIEDELGKCASKL